MNNQYPEASSPITWDTYLAELKSELGIFQKRNRRRRLAYSAVSLIVLAFGLLLFIPSSSFPEPMVPITGSLEVPILPAKIKLGVVTQVPTETPEAPTGTPEAPTETLEPSTTPKPSVTPSITPTPTATATPTSTAIATPEPDYFGCPPSEFKYALYRIDEPTDGDALQIRWIIENKNQDKCEWPLLQTQLESSDERGITVTRGQRTSVGVIQKIESNGACEGTGQIAYFVLEFDSSVEKATFTNSIGNDLNLVTIVLDNGAEIPINPDGAEPTCK